MAEGFQPEARAAQVAIVTALPSAAVWADADPDRVGQVVANLIENALKFATTRVEVGAARVGEWIAVWVSDDGPGISADDLPHIFERHYTTDRVPARKRGVGLGLAIVAELVAAMGGVVDAQSPVDAGRGARMVLWLRAVSAHFDGRWPSDAEVSPPPSPPTPALPLHPPG